MKRTDLAYIAGLFDGEGNIGIVKRRNHPHATTPIYHLVARVGMVDEIIPRWLQMAFGGYIHRRRRPDPKHRDVYTWSVGYGTAADFLKTILPFLKLKKPQAELALEFQSGKVIGCPRTVVGQFLRKREEELVVEEAQYILMRSLKR